MFQNVDFFTSKHEGSSPLFLTPRVIEGVLNISTTEIFDAVILELFYVIASS